ncbi:MULTISPECIES: Gfo/Idh/MocA family protein [Streptomyces]|uniref:Gfo/Idh/MocA family oxidoreductase n=1 Tax=Streptomyces mirabilis TaxID=68239 RepID=A0ABU3UG80_9ACTN|nr:MULTISPECIES: Gfo/Idh/MocA family oxidoreductase [Streptomyces]MCX4613394.1 Gfo/Idh/MocA family oxidoreductase [Streptomyces mirabilis]MCX5353523.1 Gfo/Idh/MocA family oxidoreductase [Streptomyces mirabilis]MDU8992902.1 Gfo/Idh/MocA family oxidoreductase [Streptomyces mirabilis]NMI62182.1 Gfo/Idh/MocA family oxidoreductase [Streptomyces sp. RLA2-12]QDN61209.1 Gfo/Idh/MocA family oxidoreductase [Streptomyces sp. S1D4-20]
MGQPHQGEAAGVEAGLASGPGAEAAGAKAGKPTLGVGMVGYAFMGAAHSQGWRTVGRVFDLPRSPVLAAVCGRDASAVRAMADQHGWAAAETDWRALIARDDVDLVDICTPGDSHAEIALAALAAGKHVLCEKPLANTVEEAEAMTEAAEAAFARGQVSMVGFNYRRLPATSLARKMVAEGRLGALRHVRVTYLQDWLVDPQFPLTWRLRKELAGSGALGDLGAHIVDLAQYLAGEPVVGVSALTETFVRERPLPGGESSGLTAVSATNPRAGGVGTVTVDDAALFTGRFASGALASFEASRFATGRKNSLRIELNGERGSLAFDLERLNELSYHDHTEPGTHAGFRRILVTEPDHPYLEAWWPPGHGLGYEHTFTHQARDLVRAIAAGRRPEPSFADGLRVQRVLAAVEESAEKNSVYTPIAV